MEPPQGSFRWERGSLGVAKGKPVCFAALTVLYNKQQKYLENKSWNTTVFYRMYTKKNVLVKVYN